MRACRAGVRATGGRRGRPGRPRAEPGAICRQRAAEDWCGGRAPPPPRRRIAAEKKEKRSRQGRGTRPRGYGEARSAGRPAGELTRGGGGGAMGAA